MIRAGTTGSERVGFDSEAASRAEQSLVIARQTDRLAVTGRVVEPGSGVATAGKAHEGAQEGGPREVAQVGDSSARDESSP